MCGHSEFQFPSAPSPAATVPKTHPQGLPQLIECARPQFSYFGVPKSWFLNSRLVLRLQVHAAQQVGKARVGAQRIEEWVHLDL
jgi:hypothetical protein